MICIKVNIPPKLCAIDDEFKAIYHCKDSVCIWLFSNRKERNRFVEETFSMTKDQRHAYYLKYFKPISFH